MSLNLEIKWEEGAELSFRCKDCQALTKNRLVQSDPGIEVQSTCPICNRTETWKLDSKRWALNP